MNKAMENKKQGLGIDILFEWDQVHTLAQAIKEEKAKIVTVNGVKRTIFLNGGIIC